MYRKPLFRALPLLFLVATLAVSGCQPLYQSLIQPVTTPGAAPTPAVSFQQGGVDNPDIFVDPAAFQTALVQALDARDTAKLQLWMTEPFLTGKWRADLSESAPADALKALYADQLGSENHLTIVKDADLKALMGGKDPLSIPRAEATAVDTVLVSGWGQDELDEAVLFLSRAADNSIKWHGWMVIKGGFSGARLGGSKLHQIDALGFSLFVPEGYSATTPTKKEISIVAPQVEGAGHPANAYITIEPANGRTSEQAANQAVEEVKTQFGDKMHTAVIGVMRIEDAQAYVVTQMPGQDLNRQLYMVHGDTLYRIMFSPEYPQTGVSYRQMEDMYAMMVNTFHFTK